MEVKGRVTLMQCQRWWYVANATALLRCWISISLAGVRGFYFGDSIAVLYNLNVFVAIRDY